MLNRKVIRAARELRFSVIVTGLSIQLRSEGYAIKRRCLLPPGVIISVSA